METKKIIIICCTIIIIILLLAIAYINSPTEFIFNFKLDDNAVKFAELVNSTAFNANCI